MDKPEPASRHAAATSSSRPHVPTVARRVAQSGLARQRRFSSLQQGSGGAWQQTLTSYHAGGFSIGGDRIARGRGSLSSQRALEISSF